MLFISLLPITCYFSIHIHLSNKKKINITDYYGLHDEYIMMNVIYKDFFVFVTTIKTKFKTTNKHIKCNISKHIKPFFLSISTLLIEFLLLIIMKNQILKLSDIADKRYQNYLLANLSPNVSLKYLIN